MVKLRSFTALAALLALWFVASFAGWINPLFLPTPVEVAQEGFRELAVTGELWPDVFATLARMLVGYALAVVLGVSLGILMGASARVYDAFDFLVDFVRSIPATALYPLFLLFFGIGDEAKVAVVIWSSALIILVNTMYGVHHASRLRVMVAKSMNVKGLALYRDVVLPEALPSIFAGLRVALGIAMVVVIVAEMFIGTNVGLGHRIIDAQLVYRIPEMYVAIIMAGVVGYALNRLFLHLERRIVHWAGR